MFIDFVGIDVICLSLVRLCECDFIVTNYWANNWQSYGLRHQKMMSYTVFYWSVPHPSKLRPKVLKCSGGNYLGVRGAIIKKVLVLEDQLGIQLETFDTCD